MTSICADNSVAPHSTQPPTAAEIANGMKDYGASITDAANALHVLEHALPLSRTAEIEAAFKIMKSSVSDLDMFLVSRGFNV